MSDIYDDLAMMRAAGSGPVLDTEYQYPPAKWGARPGNMPTVADVMADNARLRELLTTWAEMAPWDSWHKCTYCHAPLTVNTIEAYYALEQHTDDCPWSLAREYLDKMAEARR